MASNRNNNPQGNNQFTKDSGNSQSGNRGNSQSGDTSNRGFASMDPERQREIASEGGRAAHASGNAHEFNSEEARRAGSMSHKNDGNRQSGNEGNGGGNRGGNQGGNQGGRQGGSGTQGGTPEQHAQAGRQSHKNDKR
ncbi:KGG domain-containing protein [Massilia sp. YMA4]|uniref:KGG domain-containing protein n=1 Tax=[Empedobacter] haloabium TaxID=592317 RepID=A0ABZ1UDR8_9BURK|nr:KGG domain-containing protein [Massilia sp. YMA4]AXA90633.1 stress-induced protein [Massilia sp. YMA4]